MKIGNAEKFTTEVNIFKHAHIVTDTQTADKAYQHGDIFPANDATATGVVYHATEEGQPLTRILEGHLYADRLPEEPTAAAVEALRQISFYESDNEVFEPVTGP